MRAAFGTLASGCIAAFRSDRINPKRHDAKTSFPCSGPPGIRIMNELNLRQQNRVETGAAKGLIFTIIPLDESPDA